jgi:hypothetical protein
MILAASAMIWTGPYAAAVPYSYVAEAREVVSIVIPERHHLVLGGSGAFADRLGE